MGRAPFAGQFYGGRLNSGVMLVNARARRERGLARQVLDYARLHRLPEADQASIEAVFGDEGIDLDAMWNVLIDPIWGRVPLRHRIVHFLTGFEPWNLGRFLIPREIMRHWDRHAVPNAIRRPLGPEVKLLSWQMKTLSLEAMRSLSGRR